MDQDTNQQELSEESNLDRHPEVQQALRDVSHQLDNLSGTPERVVVQLAAHGDIAYRVYYKEDVDYDGGVITAD
jgi:hypothetical protein